MTATPPAPLRPSTSLPQTLALVDDDAEYAEYLAQHLRRQGIGVRTFADSYQFLADPDAWNYGFYLLDLMLPGVDGVELIRILRMRSDAGVLVVSGRLGSDVFTEVIGAGADMILAKPVQFEQVSVAIEAVHRRAARPPAETVWRLNRRRAELLTPDGAAVALSEADLAVLECFVRADGGVVTRDTLRAELGAAGSPLDDDSLNATIYRLRRRIERATPLLVPLQSRSRVGYVFKAPLQVA